MHFAITSDVHVSSDFLRGTVAYYRILVVCVYAAVLFLEFWKRRQFQLQYDWDMLGYEDAEVNQTHIVHVQFCFTFFLSML